MPKFQIGQKYIKRGKRKDICTVIDIHTTYNSAGEVVKERYVSTHTFMGQVVTDRDVVETTIAMGAIDA